MRLLASLLFAVASSLLAQAPTTAPTAPPAREHTGACMLAGGGKLPPEVFARFHELAGGATAHIVLIPTASQSADDAKSNEDTLRLFQDRLPGAAITLLHTRDRAKADDEAFTAPLRSATGVWLGGGAQDRLASAYLGTRVEKELMALLARGGVIAGTSAGTAIQTRTMIQEGMENPVVATGFDFVPGAISDQHFLKRKRLPRLLKVLGEHPGLVGIGVDEGTVAEIRGDSLRVLGSSKVVIVLAARSGHEQVVRAIDPFAPEDAPLDLGSWRRAAVERATWSLDETAHPALDRGALLIGDAAGIAARFVALAGGRAAKIVVFADLDADAQRLRDTLREAGADEVRTFAFSAMTGTAEERDTALATATGVVFGDRHPRDTRAMLAARGRPSAGALRGVLARGGVVWGNGIVGEVAAGSWSSTAATAEDFGYDHGLSLLPGTMIVHRPLQYPTPDDPSRGSSTDGAPHEWVYRHAARLPRIVGIHVESAAVVTGSTLEVLGDSPTHVLPTRADGKPGDERTKVTLEPGAKWDLVAQKRL